MNKYGLWPLRIIYGLLIMMVSVHSMASIIISGTRVIYSAEQKEVTVKLTNVGKKPVLIQAWIDRGNTDESPESIRVPFILTPSINRVNPDQGQMLRLSFTGPALPADRESVFWLNVLELPAKVRAGQMQNHLQMAFRTRIKLFYRPEGLKGKANEAIKEARWYSANGKISVTNPTPYHISLVSLAFKTPHGEKIIEGQMLEPQSTREIPFNEMRREYSGQSLNVEFVNDYGAINKMMVRLSG